jgi:hypothetical protein
VSPSSDDLNGASAAASTAVLSRRADEGRQDGSCFAYAAEPGGMGGSCFAYAAEPGGMGGSCFAYAAQG